MHVVTIDTNALQSKEQRQILNKNKSQYKLKSNDVANETRNDVNDV